MLCVCLGIVEGAMLLLAGIFASIPFLSKLFRLRKQHRRSVCCDDTLHDPLRDVVERKIKHKKRIPYVTSADVVKMSKRDKK